MNERETTDEEFGIEELEDAETFDRLFGIVADGVVGAAGGLVGTAMLTVVLLIAESIGAFSMEAFGSIARTAGLDAFGPAIVMGYLLFLAGGTVPWPLLFASLKEYLPGGSDPVKGIVFGTVLWTGFALAFNPGFVGLTLVAYLVLTLVAHWAYGVGLGVVFEYLATRSDSLV
ncbi:DUF6789 family protein [Natronorarus salvus]|uniref:DUF6789 family protein n=1 Tax=Natronorarus salvus TaxID=3117733 RepID=UPI002F265429